MERDTDGFLLDPIPEGMIGHKGKVDTLCERILEALRAAPGGLTRTEISRGLFHHNVPGYLLELALGRLERQRRAVSAKERRPKGRSATRYWARQHAVKPDPISEDAVDRKRRLNALGERILIVLRAAPDGLTLPEIELALDRLERRRRAKASR